MGKPITLDVEISSVIVYSLSFSLFEKVYFLNFVLVLVSSDRIMAPSSLSHRTSSTAAALSFDGIVIKSWFFCCYCVIVDVCVVFLSVVCCRFFVCSIVGFVLPSL